MNENTKCSHDGCVCRVGDDEEYCSQYCQDAGDTDITEIKCDCGHPGCE